jgi:hypothetical protein
MYPGGPSNGRVQERSTRCCTVYKRRHLEHIFEDHIDFGCTECFTTFCNCLIESGR